MPSHIDVLVGDYENGIRANEDAIAADEVFLAREGPLNFYVRYLGASQFLHWHHSKAVSASFEIGPV